ncbi:MULTISPECIES: Rv3654c family TadE-like protein [unclassified Microcella]|uniref:Rv3654c family TadE-like protein n=1 Tax=unclassified Microcella TaxID=2630066 RepID=UPI0006F91EE4|nr:MULTISPECIES: Rv3654c family TadE-like protein [unclassified Microcella]KQV26841.1 hypothetical protein ASC54_04660 [Yonghaparkia sp. Root332]KRF33836.1 hypothetical protein ASG83_03025 [Yonghaparkia sp. Soil809]
MAGAPLVVGLLAVVALGGGGMTLASTALAESQRLAGVADAAALGGGDALLGWVPGPPCAVAERVAEANGAGLSGCRVEGLEIVVSVSGTTAGIPVQRSARAGPPRS